MSVSVSTSYERLERLAATSASVLFRGRRRADGAPALLKSVNAESPLEVARLEREVRTLRALKVSGVLEPFDAEPALVALEAFDGISLETWLASHTPEWRDCARIGVRLAKILEGLHAARWVHGDLRPLNFLIDFAGRDLRLADLSHARFHGEHTTGEPEQEPPVSLDWAYVSPEQTGRVNRRLDHRTDFYSLGIMLYRMASGAFPFNADSPLEWAHCHVARRPKPLREANPALPRALSDVVDKLLAKDPDERYRSAYGVRRDLERCLATSENDASFVLGEHDIGEPFALPHALYGRDRERAALAAAFGAMAKSGQAGLVLLRGSSGIGKSALAEELGAVVENSGGRFLSGKFDALGRDVPYGAIASPLRSLLQHVSSGSAEQLAAFRARLGAALGVHAAAVAELIPEVELVLGELPELPELPAMAARTRFQTAFADFVRAAARPEEPLVLFLDDLQWADDASLSAIERVLASPETRHLLVLGAQRDGEPALDDAAARMRVSLHNAPHLSVSELELGPLEPAALVEWLHAALGAARDECAPLGALLERKTGANPFFVREFLGTLHRRGLLWFDGERGRWSWDIERLKNADLTDNVAELTAAQIAELPAGTRAALELGACLGHGFDLATLAALSHETPSRVAAELRPALDRDLIVIDGELGGAAAPSYRFSHDRVQQAAIALVPASRAARLHLDIGRHLARDLTADSPPDALFTAAHHLSLGASSIEDFAEKLAVAKLDLDAVRRARASSAYSSGLRYAAAGLALLGADPWLYAELAYALHFAAAECEYLVGQTEPALARARSLLEHAPGKREKAAVLRLMHDALFATGQFQRAVESELACLRLLGVDLPDKPTWDDVRAACEHIRELLGERPIEAVVELPRMTDPELEAVDIAAASFFVDPKVYALQSARLVALAIEHGNSDAAPLWYGGYGAALTSYFEAHDDGYRFAKAARELWIERPTPAREARIHFLLGWTAYWKEPLSEALEHYYAGRRAAEVNADTIVGCYCASRIAYSKAVQGGALDSVHDEIENLLSFVRRAGVRDIAELVLVYRQYVRALLGRTRSLSSFDDDEFDERALEARLGDPRLASVASRYWILKLRACFASGDFAAARRAAQNAEPLLGTAAGQPPLRDFVLYRALALTGDFEQAEADEQRARLAIIEDCRTRLERFARANATTFRHGHALVRAELARVLGRDDEAARAYEESIEWAERGAFAGEAALAHELYARFHRDRSARALHDLHLGRACALYAQVRATRKLEQLGRENPAARSVATALGELRSNSLDFLAVLQASQAISSEIVLERLLETLMRTVLSSAGADRGALLLMQGGAPLIAAHGQVEGDALTIEIPSARAPTAEELPLPILTYVQRTRERVILGDARQNNPFALERRGAAGGPKSLSCLPIIQGAELRGLLYLENHLVTDAFTPERTVALELLAAQAAVSLENARLFAERKSAEQRFATAFHESPTPMAITRIADGVFVDVNESQLRLLGYTREEMIGKSTLEIGFIDPEQRATVRRAMREHRSVRDVELELKTKSGQTRFVTASMEIIEVDGVSCFLSTTTDVTFRIASLSSG